MTKALCLRWPENSASEPSAHGTAVRATFSKTARSFELLGFRELLDRRKTPEKKLQWASEWPSERSATKDAAAGGACEPRLTSEIAALPRRLVSVVEAAVVMSLRSACECRLPPDSSMRLFRPADQLPDKILWLENIAT